MRLLRHSRPPQLVASSRSPSHRTHKIVWRSRPLFRRRRPVATTCLARFGRHLCSKEQRFVEGVSELLSDGSRATQVGGNLRYRDRSSVLGWYDNPNGNRHVDDLAMMSERLNAIEVDNLCISVPGGRGLGGAGIEMSPSVCCKRRWARAPGRQQLAASADRRTVASRMWLGE